MVNCLICQERSSDIRYEANLIWNTCDHDDCLEELQRRLLDDTPEGSQFYIENSLLIILAYGKKTTIPYDKRVIRGLATKIKELRDAYRAKNSDA